MLGFRCIATLCITALFAAGLLGSQAYAYDMSRGRQSKNVIDRRVERNLPDFHRQLILLSDSISDIQSTSSWYKYAVQDSFCARYAKRTKEPMEKLSSRLSKKPDPTQLSVENPTAEFSSIAAVPADACNRGFAAGLESRAQSLESVKRNLSHTFGSERMYSEALWKTLSIDAYTCEKEEPKAKPHNPDLSSIKSNGSGAPSFELRCYQILSLARNAVGDFRMFYDKAERELESKIASLRELAKGSVCKSDGKN